MSLQEWLAKNGQGESDSARAEWFAQRLGVTAMAVRRYVSGQRLPRRQIMDRIRSLTAGAVLPADFYPESGDCADAAQLATNGLAAGAAMGELEQAIVEAAADGKIDAAEARHIREHVEQVREATDRVEDSTDEAVRP